MRKTVFIIIAVLALALAVFGSVIKAELSALVRGTIDKPIIYLYPEEETDVSVVLDYDGELTVTYPEYQGEWKVTAFPDGTLIDESGRSYYGLFWEGEEDLSYDCSKGFVVPGNETRAFLESSLKALGLTDKEANEFIVFWLPQMINNEYNFISFQQESYTDHARLHISPEPDCVIRVFMAWKPLKEAVEVSPQVLTAPERKGFTVVEWGGTRLEQ